MFVSDRRPFVKRPCHEATSAMPCRRSSVRRKSLKRDSTDIQKREREREREIE
jgi:hypothetical protein